MSPSDTLLAAFRGTDGETDYLLEEWADGVRIIRIRPHFTDGWTTWSAPVQLAQRPIALAVSEFADTEQARLAAVAGTGGER